MNLIDIAMQTSLDMKDEIYLTAQIAVTYTNI